jgi:pyruvate formate lyase activating enzyme
MAQMAVDNKAQGNLGIAYTYNEPFISYEYLVDTAPLIAAAGMKNVLVTNGVVEAEPLQTLLPYIHAMNVDIKSMSDDFYRRLCGGRTQAPRETVEAAVGRCHVEITNLLIPGENDADDQIQTLVDWVAGVSKHLPVHFSAYHPAHRFKAAPTPASTVKRAYDIAIQKLKYVYIGNLYLDGTTDTRCPDCGVVAVTRNGFQARPTGISEGRCSSCGAELNIIQ